MRPLQVYIADDEYERLETWSQARGWTKSQAIRAAVRALTRPRGEDALLSLSGMIHDQLPPDCSEQFDRYLQETYVAESPVPYRKKRRLQKRTRR